VPVDVCIVWTICAQRIDGYLAAPLLGHRELCRVRADAAATRPAIRCTRICNFAACGNGPPRSDARPERPGWLVLVMNKLPFALANGTFSEQRLAFTRPGSI